MPGKLTTKTEPVGARQPLTCFSCPVSAEFQETAFLGEEELPVKVVHCGHRICLGYAQKEALRRAEEKVQEMVNCS